jgi:AcrR family transcriptional regulator
MVEPRKGRQAGSPAAPSGAVESPNVPPTAAPPKSPKDAIIDALLELAAEREWKDISIPDIAERAGVSLADFRDAFPSKGAVLGGFARRIDGIVLRQTVDDMKDETAKERLFDVLMRRLDAMAPYRLGLDGVAEWVRRDPLAAAALNQSAINSMRFMLAAAGIDTEGQAGQIKIQGLVFAWTRVLAVWFKDEDPGLAATMAALDSELVRGETLAARVDDADRLATPFKLVAQSLMNMGRRMQERASPRQDGDVGA